jgi:protease II
LTVLGAAARTCCRYQGYYYYTRTEEGQQYAVHCRRAVAPGAGAPAESDEPAAGQAEEVLLDENKRKEDGKHSFYMVGAVTCWHDVLVTLMSCALTVT